MLCTPPTANDAAPECITQLLYQFDGELSRLDSVVSHVPPLPEDHQHVPYVGNGHVALVARADSPLYVRDQRTLNLTVPYLPVLEATLDAASTEPHEAVLVQYASGVVQRLVCYPMPPGDRHLDLAFRVGVASGDGRGRVRYSIKRRVGPFCSEPFRC